MTNPFKRYRIDNLFFRSIAIFISVVLACTVWASSRIFSNELAQKTSYYQQQLLDQLNSDISARLGTVEQISLSTSRDSDLIALLISSDDGYERYRRSKSTELALANLTYSIPLIQGIDLYMDRPLEGDSKSYIQFRSNKEAADQPWSGLLKRSDFSWSSEHAVPSFQGNVPVISFARKIIYDDKYLGTLVIHVKAESIRGMLAGQSPGVNRIMFDAAGQRLLAIGQAPDVGELSEWVEENTAPSGFTHIHGKWLASDSLLVYSKANDSGWMLVEITPWEQITEGSYRLAKVIVMIGIAAILLTLVLTHWWSRQFTKPIKQLVGAMSAYSVGGKPVELPGDYENEFGYLFAGYRKQNERIEELYRSLKRRHERQRKAEIEALQANINPHFLYNTLDQLNWMAIAARQDEISRILELMGQMFRIGLSNGESFITVGEELTHVECYLEIQQLRWGSGLEYTIEAPQEIRSLFLPKLTLQPFVENAVVHGFNGRTSGHIGIRVDVDAEQTVRICVEDDGHGLKQTGKPAQHKRHTGGYGVRNVRERITGYFGQGFGVSLTDREAGGARAVITLPRLVERPKPEEQQDDSA